MSFANNIKAIRKENNLSQEQLAEKLGVSRQSVSKWESNQSYPEMDKILLICKLFNYDIGELMNENIKEVSETKQSKSKANKAIEDFFDYITRFVDMFTAMTFKQKLKCLFEQAVIVTVLLIIGLIARSIIDSVIYKLFGFLEYDILDIIRSVFDSITLVACIAVSVAVLLHIFKIRYLDYYEIVKTEAVESAEEPPVGKNAAEDAAAEPEEAQPPKETLFSRKQEKIVIRDPKHSGSKFLVSIINAVIFLFKLVLGFIGIFFALSFVFCAAMLVTSFLIARSGILFAGIFLCIAALIALNFLILRLIYNFIASRKSRKNVTALILIISLTVAGIGAGLTFVGATGFDIADEAVMTQTEFFLPMRDDMVIYLHYPTEFVESDRNDVKIEVTHSELTDAYLGGSESNVYAWADSTGKAFEQLRAVIDGINSKKLNIAVFGDPIEKITVYASKENIEKIMRNNGSYESTQAMVDELHSRISELEAEVSELEYEVIDLEGQLAERDEEIAILNTQIMNSFE